MLDKKCNIFLQKVWVGGERTLVLKKTNVSITPFSMFLIFFSLFVLCLLALRVQHLIIIFMLDNRNVYIIYIYIYGGKFKQVFILIHYIKGFIQLNFHLL